MLLLVRKWVDYFDKKCYNHGVAASLRDILAGTTMEKQTPQQKRRKLCHRKKQYREGRKLSE